MAVLGKVKLFFRELQLINIRGMAIRISPSLDEPAAQILL